MSWLLKSRERLIFFNFNSVEKSQLTILHMSRQLSCRDMSKIVAWYDYEFLHMIMSNCANLDYELLNS